MLSSSAKLSPGSVPSCSTFALRFSFGSLLNYKISSPSDKSRSNPISEKEQANSMSSIASKSKITKPAFKLTSGRLFFLDLGGGRVFTSNPDGSDLKTIVNEGRRLPDGIVVDAAGGHIYWTNMG